MDSLDLLAVQRTLKSLLQYTVQKHHIDFKWKLTIIEKVIDWECEGRNSSYTLPLPSYVA